MPSTRQAQKIRSAIVRLEHSEPSAPPWEKPTNQAKAERERRVRRSLCRQLRYLAANGEGMEPDQLRRQRRAILATAKASGNADLVAAVEAKLSSPESG